MKPFILGAIFARGGSKGIPGKNIKPLAGKPLIGYAIEAAQACSLIDHVVVSTDSDQIAQTAKQFGADVPFMRPAELATDESHELVAWQHAVKTYEQLSGKNVDVMVSVPTTSPLRNVDDVTSCAQKILDTDADVVLTVRPAERNPYFNMVMLDRDEYAHLVMTPKEVIDQRQKAPKIFDVTTVAYAIRTQYLKNAKSLLAGKVKTVLVPPERAIDIDTMFDFEIAEYFISKGANSCAKQ